MPQILFNYEILGCLGQLKIKMLDMTIKHY